MNTKIIKEIQIHVDNYQHEFEFLYYKSFIKILCETFVFFARD